MAALGTSFYNFLARYWRNEFGMKIKDCLRPMKHALVQKNGIYKAIDRVGELEKRRGRSVKVVLDVGAAIGEAALPMLRAYPEAQLYCFEPIPDQFERLKKRTQEFEARVQYFNHALFDKNDEAQFHLLINHPDGSSFIEGLPGTRKITVKRRKLDDVVKELGLTHIDFLKIDVEGVEKEVLAGASETLKMTDNVFVEVAPLRKGMHNHDYIDVFESLYQAGLSFEGVYSEFDYFFSRILPPDMV